MITYQPDDKLGMIQVTGSVLPRACKYSMVISLMATTVRILDRIGSIKISPGPEQFNLTLFGAFTFTLSFFIVFRTNQIYIRFWQCASSVCTMRSMLYEAASSLVAFTYMSPKTSQEKNMFIYRIIRLTSLLHASALESVSTVAIQDLPVLDIEGLALESLEPLQKYDGKQRVDLVYHWLSALIVEDMKSGVLSVPPPILTRVFQELERAMTEYNQTYQITKIPFPFPYAQAATFMLAMHAVATPCLVIFYTGHPAITFLITFMCTLGLFFDGYDCN